MKNNKENFEQKVRHGCRDIWNAYMCKGARYTTYDIPYCPTTTGVIPKAIITWEEAKVVYKKEINKKNYDFLFDEFVCFYIDDYKFDGLHGIWHDSKSAIKILRHFAGIITPDFSTYQDFPEPLKIYNTYRMRAFGYWLGENGISVINNVRWGTSETYRYCFNGIPKDSIVCIGTVGGSPRKLIDRDRFENGLREMIQVLHPHTIIVYGSANYKCFDNLKSQGINIVAFPSQMSLAFKKEGKS